MGIHLSTLLKHYKRKEVQEAILSCAENKEIAIKFGDKGFGKRPDVLKYPQDILEFALRGATSFHVSEETWDNPLQLQPGMKRKDLDDLRNGWDLVLDIDCKYLGYSKVAAELTVQALEYHGIKSIFVKFSGNHGFHIAVPFESFPEKVGEENIKDLFPEGPKKIAAYLSSMIESHLSQQLLSIDDINKVAENAGMDVSDIVKDGKFDPFKVVAIDTVLISSRHLYRMPYSFNEKSGLISIPIKREEIMTFDLSKARPSNVVVDVQFINRENSEKNESRRLLVEALDHKIKQEELTIKKVDQDREFQRIENALPVESFPPCIKLTLQGMRDGKKRSLFVLVNFLTKVGWDYEQIEELLNEWNEKNTDPLSQTLIMGQIRYHKMQNKELLPPNCDNEGYYTAFQICKPDNLCSKIKNPVNYAILRARSLAEVSVKQTNKEEEKEEKS